MKKNNLTIRERVTRTVEKWYILEPLCFLIWTTHELTPNPGIRTLRTGNGYIEYNPAFLEALPDHSLEAVLKAEVIRILLKHPYSRRKEHAEAAYLASNITLKEHADLPLPFPSAMEVFGEKDFEKRHFEYYYERLTDMGGNGSALPQKGAGDGQTEKSRTSPANDPNKEKVERSRQHPPQGKTDGPPPQSPDKEGETIENQPAPSLDDYADARQTGHENTERWSENEWVSQLVNDKIEIARQSRSWGTLPGKLQELILAAMRPRLDYRRILSAFRQSVLSTQRTLTRMKPSRRYGFQYMGSRRDFCTRLLFAFDVSGSVPSQDLRRALAMLNQFFRYGVEAIDVVQFDTELKSGPSTVKKARRQLEITGRGGTDFNPVFRFLDEHRQYDGAVVFTDGYAPPPTPLKHGRTKVLWLFNTEECYNANYAGLKKTGKGAFLK